MRFYRLHVRRLGGESEGYLWFTSLGDATQERCELDSMAQDESDKCEPIEAVDIVPSKAGILAALREFASHADNG